MKRFIPIPGDIIIVEKSEWYALKDGERLRVCEHCEWVEVGEELCVAPRHQVTTFWGPDHGPPNGILPISMSTSGGPFKTVRIKDLEGLELIGEKEDVFWCWEDWPRAGGGIDRNVTVALWRVRLLPDEHHRRLQEYGLVPSFDWDERRPIERVADDGISIRLGCKECDRTDFENCAQLPVDWKDIEVVAGQEVNGWETHLAVCPDCQKETQELDKLAADEVEQPVADPELADAVHPIICQIIDRDCHVGTPSYEVVRHVILKLRHGYDTYRAMTPAERSMLVSQVAMHHRSNFKLYVEVMSGLSRTAEEGTGQFPATLSGKAIVGLMRKHRVKLRELAYRLGTTLKRIRQIRKDGLKCALTIRDWIQAITGDDVGPIPEPIVIAQKHESTSCEFCGMPLQLMDPAYAYVGEVYCSVTCCRTSRGW